MPVFGSLSAGVSGLPSCVDVESRLKALGWNQVDLLEFHALAGRRSLARS